MGREVLQNSEKKKERKTPAANRAATSGSLCKGPVPVRTHGFVNGKCKGVHKWWVLGVVKVA